MNKSPEAPLTFPRVVLIHKQTELITPVIAEFGDEAHGWILLLTGPRNTQAFAEVYGKLIREEWSQNLSERVLANPPSRAAVLELEQQITKEGAAPSVVVYVGSQTVADSAKFLVKRLRTRYPNQTIVFGGIITGLSGDGIFSSTASLRDDDGIPVSESAVAPNFIVGDKLTLLRSPFEMKSSCIGDILSKISSLWDYKYSCWVLKKYHNNFAADLAHAAYESLLSANVANKHFLHNGESIEILFRATQLCGISMQLAGSSETCSGSEHVGEKWLQEFIIRFNNKNHDQHLDTPKHGAALMPMVIATLYLQGQAEKAERVKEIARNVGLPCKATELGLNGTVLQMCLALGFGYRCPRYAAYLIADAPFPEAKDVVSERVTVLEQIEFKVLLDAIRQSMIDSEVSCKEDFRPLDSAHCIAMQILARTVLDRFEAEIQKTVDNDTAKRARQAFARVLLKDYYID